jgi:hypothetical protein
MTPSREAFRAARTANICEVCATCRHYWQGVERRGGDLRGTCTAPSPCGSPIAGDAFTHYDGPIGDFTARCFVCGKDADNALEVVGKARRVGVCRQHIGLVMELQAQRESAGLVVVGPSQTPIVNVLPKRSPSLRETMEATEAEWQADDLRRYG